MIAKIISLIIGIGMIFCGSFAAAEALEYTDSLVINNGSFTDSEFPWRISASSGIKNHGDSSVKKNGDSDVVYGNTANSELVYVASEGQEFIVTAYLAADALAENVFALEFSVDKQSWTLGYTSIAEYMINTENISGEPWRACILKAVVPDECTYARVRWIAGSWKYMLGEVQMRNPVDRGDFVDELTDFKTVSETSMYMKKYTKTLSDETSCSVAERMPYYCDVTHEFDESSAIVGKYGVYTPGQYLIYDLDSSQRSSICIQTVYDDDVNILHTPFKFYIKTEMGWERKEAILHTEGVRAAYYLEDICEGAKQLKIVFPIEESERWDAAIERVTVRPAGGIKAEVKGLAYFVDGERVYSTPANYGDTVGITGAITDKADYTLVNPRLIAAAYDSAGKIVAVNNTGILKPTAPGEERDFSIELTDLDFQAESIKLFFWEENEPVAVCAENVVYKPEEFDTSSGTLTDNFEDLSKLWEVSSGFKIETDADSEVHPGYANVLLRDYNLKRAMKYKVYGADSMTITAFRFRKIGTIRVYASGYDGGYKEVNTVLTGNSHTADDWWTANYTVSEFPEDTTYIKIEIDKGSGASWTPSIAQVEINY
ncbi:MAG: hypothetical protein J6C82_06960 [Clostridia bacterium]|nr:hypothetical protein [Clostridia bacterium]